tara:strand:- start:294 stop:668 length:375 start_codon:yes stop_codon:yes gene_type:complete
MRFYHKSNLGTHRSKKREIFHHFVKEKDKKKPDQEYLIGLEKKAGIVLLFHRGSPAVPSPLAGLTSEFGMGSGVPLPLLTPANFENLLEYDFLVLVRKQKIHLMIFSVQFRALKKSHDQLVRIS